MERRKLLLLGILLILVSGFLFAILPVKNSEAAKADMTSVCENNQGDRKCLVETIRYIGADNKSTYERWLIASYSVDRSKQYIIFYPIEGEFAGKQFVVPFSNIHLIREI